MFMTDNKSQNYISQPNLTMLKMCHY